MIRRPLLPRKPEAVGLPMVNPAMPMSNLTNFGSVTTPIRIEEGKDWN